MSTTYSTAVQWFLTNQRMTSYDPATETPEQGALRCAQDYAMAEQHADENGWVLTYQRDSEDPKALEVILFDAEGNDLAALGGVEAEASPSWYRAIRAELALDAIAI